MMMTWHKCDAHHKYSHFLIKYDAYGDSTYITHHLISFELAASVGDQNRFESTYDLGSNDSYGF